ncbi:MAG: hypothetical protein FWH46_05780 [Methanimicrococcus sp.]|nr:hypothetical protein [Methanimicrococcus sp.]
MPICKNCNSRGAVKNGIVRGKQRYKCKMCAYNFVEDDQQANNTIAAKKDVHVVLHPLDNDSVNTLAKAFDILPPLVPKPEASDEIKEMTFDEIWHFIDLKKENYASSKPLIVVHGEL